MEVNNSTNSFFGVYLLKSKNPKHNDLVYIGFTVNPNRRIKQHNRGKDFGGAWKTSGKGPWDMVMLVHGFPNEIAALRFEWCWQHPNKSRMLRDAMKRRYGKETEFEYRLRILGQMCHTGPFWRLPLKINILSLEQSIKIRQIVNNLPNHISLEDGQISEDLYKERKKLFMPENEDQYRCHICKLFFNISAPVITCDSCHMISHLICLAKHLLGPSKHIIPVQGKCPSCFKSMFYGELIRNNLSFYK